MTEEGKWDSTGFDKLMKDSKNELLDLQNQLQNLMVKFCLRALRVYQATRPEPLRPNEVSLLTKNELNNAIADLTAQTNMDNIAKLVKEEWAKQQKP
jgi:asparagine synthetase A